MLYHSEVFMPKKISGLFPRDGRKQLAMTQHAIDQANAKAIDLRDSIDLTQFSLVELEVSFGKWSKAVIRENNPSHSDACLVLVVIPTNNRVLWKVKTVWLNKLTDNHSTLDIRAYAQRAA
jgi:hypothetical protein